MIIEAIRSVREALEHSTYGINAQLAAMTLDRVDDTLPTALTIIDQTTDIEAALDRFKDVDQCVTVNMAEPVTFDTVVQNYSYRDAKIRLRIMYLASNDRAETATSEQFYLCLAIQRCLASWLSNTNADDRMRNNVQIINATDMLQEILTVQAQDSATLCGVLATFHVRDHSLGV